MALQTLPPSAAVISSVGLAVSGGSTTSTTPVIKGTADAGDIVSVYDGIRLLGTALAGADGNWSFTPTVALKAGTHNFAAIPQDSHGNVGASSNVVNIQIVPNTTPAPVITNVLDTVGTSADLVTIPSGSATNGNQPTISGTGVIGDTVTIYQNGTACGSTVVDATGHWSIKASPAMSDGTHVMTATQIGNGLAQSGSSNAWSINIITNAPTTPAAPTLTDDSGAAIPAGSTTADAHPHINGTGVAGDVIKVYDNGTEIGSTTVGGDGKWSFTPSTDLSNGTHSITVVDVNAAGTPSAASGAISVVIAAGTPATPAAPSLTDDNANAIPAGSATYDAHPHINGTGVAGDIIKVYDGSTLLGSVKVAGNGTWTFTPTTDLSAGSHSINVTETNAAGTSSAHSASTAFSVNPSLALPVITSIVDSVGPIQGNIAQGGVTDDPRPVFHGTGVPGDVVTVGDNWNNFLGSVVVNALGQWTFQSATNLSNGAHSVVAMGKLVSGWSPVWSFTVDTTTPATPAAPLLTDDNGATIPAGSTTNEGHPHISGTGKAGDIITVYDGSTVLGSTTVGSNGQWTFTPSSDLSKGSHSINVTETNLAGTQSAHSASVSFTYAVVTAPTETVVITNLIDHTGGGNVPSGGSTKDTSPGVQGTLSSGLLAGETVVIYRDGVKVGNATVSGTGWTFQDSGLAVGSHYYEARVESSAGYGPTSNHFTFNEIAPAPVAPTETVVITNLIDHAGGGNVPSGGSTKDTSPGVQGTLSSGLLAGETVVIYRDGVKVGNATVSGTSWTFQDAGLAVGSHFYEARVESGAGYGPTSNHFTFNEIAPAPVAPTETVVITNLIDHAAGGNVPSGGSTKDTSPGVQGTLSSGLLAGETVVIYRDNVKVGTATVSGTGWTFQDSGLAVGSHYYEARVESSAGYGPTSNHFTFSEIAVPTDPIVITNLVDHTSGSNVYSGGSTSDKSPTVQGTLATGLQAGETVVVYRDGNRLGQATVSGTSWTLRDSGVGAGSHYYNARVETTSIVVATSSTFNFTEAGSVPVTPTETLSISYLIDHLTGGAVYSGGSTKDTSPGLWGTLSSSLLDGEKVSVYRDGSYVGVATVSTSGWLFQDSGVGQGSHYYEARVTNSVGSGPMSSRFSFSEGSATLPAPTETVVITNLIDHTGAGNVPSGGSTKDTSPGVQGTLSSGLLAGETVVIYRDGVKVGNATVSGTGWTYQDSGLVVGSHFYEARVESSAGNGPTSNHFTFNEIAAGPVIPTETVQITSLNDHSSGANIPAGATTSDTAPVVHGSVSSTLQSGETLVVYRDGNKVGNATMSGTSWTFNDSGVGAGNHTYTARVENSAGNGAYSSGYGFTEAPVVTNISGVLLIDCQGINPRGDVYTTGYRFYSGVTGPFGQSYLEVVGRPGATVYTYDNGRLIDTKVIPANGTPLNTPLGNGLCSWFVMLNKLSNGTHAFTTKQVLNGQTQDGLFPFIVNSGGTVTYDTNVNSNSFSNGTTPPVVPVQATRNVAANEADAASVVADPTQTDSNKVAPVTSNQEPSEQPQHVAVGDHQAFTGTSGHDTVDLNMDPGSYFKETMAHIQGSTVHPVDAAGIAPVVNTLHLAGDHQVLDLTSLTGKTAAAKISGIEVIDLGGHENSVKLSLTDVLNLGEPDLFVKDGKQQMMINGSDGDTVDLSNAHIAGVADGQWQQEATAVVGGVSYNVYEHSGAHTELLVQQGVQVVVH
ncbi:Ig-like domain-containing protein [Caballeronia sp. KNU42]